MYKFKFTSQVCNDNTDDVNIKENTEEKLRFLMNSANTVFLSGNKTMLC